MLKTEQKKYYQVRAGQTLEEIAAYFSVSARLLARENGLTAPPPEGRILHIPSEKGNAYIVREGDTPSLLCGSEEGFIKKNGGRVFYLGMRVIL